MAGERLIEIMQAAALGATENAVMANLLFGEVTEISPLKVRIDNRFELDEDFLVIPQNLTDYEVEMEVTQESGTTGTALEGTTYAHNHSYDKYVTTKSYTVKNALQVGDKVALLRAMGGQRYYILDRVG